MPTIFYGLPGEGLGHASRTAAILENLIEVDVHLFTWGEAYDFFAKQNYPHLYRIAGFPFARNKENRIHVLKTLKNVSRFLVDYNSSVALILEVAKKNPPDLFVSDFEPILPRVSLKLAKPCVSIDNQHSFSRCDISDLPFGLRTCAMLIGRYAESIVSRPRAVVVSTFYPVKLKSRVTDTTLVNCLMRQTFEKYMPQTGDYALVYYKSCSGSQMLAALSQAEIPVKVYNCPLAKRTYPQFEYFDVSSENFIKDLAGCRCLFCGSGSQLLGEAVYYGKPVFTIPEPKQPEQIINAFYIEKNGYGRSIYINELTSQKVADFLANFKCWPGVGINGTRRAVEVIKACLNGAEN